MKHVLEIIGKLYIGGAEKVARDIGYYADKTKYQIDYVVFEDEIGAYEKELEDEGCRIYHLAPPSKSYRKFLQSIANLIRENHYDVIHSHTMFNSGWTMYLAKRMGVPIRVAHSHSIRGFEHRGFKKNTYEKFMRKLILRNATHLIGCGTNAGNWLFGENSYAKRGITILNGVDVNRFSFSTESRDAIRKKLHIENKFVIGHVGHLVPVKNQSFLISLMPELLKKNPNTILLLLGDGDDKGLLQNEVQRLSLQHNVIFTGNVSDVYNYLSAMDVFVFPSLYEGMPLSLIEVQSNGLPCIISDCVPKDIYLTDLIHPLSLDDPAKWINMILTSKRSHPEQYCGTLIDEGFDVSSMVGKIYKLYEE